MAGEILIPFDPRTGEIFESTGRCPWPTTLQALLFEQGTASAATLQFVPGTVVNGAFRGDSSAFAAQANLDIFFDGHQKLSGAVKLGFGANSTEAISLDRLQTERQVHAALNELDSIAAAGGVTVRQLVPGAFSVLFDSAGARNAITVTHEELGALSSRVIEISAGSVSAREECILDFRQTVLLTIANASFSALSTTPTASFATAVTGGSGSKFEVLTLPARLDGGFFRLSHNGGDDWTDAIPWDAGAFEVQRAVDGLADDTWIVSQKTDRIFEFYRTELVSGTVLSIDDDTLAMAGGKSAAVNFESIRNFLRSTENAPRPGEPVALRMVLTTSANFSTSPFSTLLDLTFYVRRAAEFA